MIKKKTTYIIVITFICLSLAACLFTSSYERPILGLSSDQDLPEYATKVFGSDIISLEIIADEKLWQTILDNAADEQYIPVDVIVNGTKFEQVGIRPKGNSSLSQVINSESNRYSFRLKFDKYIEGQTCFGLESFVVNNMISDNTYMKEYLSYDILRTAGVETPFFSFADIKVNGNDFGFYLAVELYGDSYEQRVFGDTTGMLYNVKSMDLGNNNHKQKTSTDKGSPVPFEENKQMPPASHRSAGGSLEYTDDKIESYNSIFNNVVGKGSDSDYSKVITALKALSENRDIDAYFDIDKTLRYLAAHTAVVNLDSYSSSMAQNYYIYERNGQLTILPWDYNMAFGGFQCKDASSVINFPIDTPVSGIEMTTRPLINNLLSNEQYMNAYHNYLQGIVDNYFANGKFKEKVESLDKLISYYVKKDASAFCTYDEYKKAVNSLITLGTLRGESIQGQLDGDVPSTTEMQKTLPNILVSDKGLDFAALGQNMMDFKKEGKQPPDMRNGEQNGKTTNL